MFYDRTVNPPLSVSVLGFNAILIGVSVYFGQIHSDGFWHLIVASIVLSIVAAQNMFYWTGNFLRTQNNDFVTIISKLIVFLVIAPIFIVVEYGWVGFLCFFVLVRSVGLIFDNTWAHPYFNSRIQREIFRIVRDDLNSAQSAKEILPIAMFLENYPYVFTDVQFSHLVGQIKTKTDRLQQTEDNNEKI